MYDRTCVIHGTKIERKIVRTNELKLNLSSHGHLFGKVAQRVVVLAVVVVVARHGGPVLRWARRLQDRANFFWHISQLKGLSPETKNANFKVKNQRIFLKLQSISN